mgnify:CR=1 FL=1
MSKVVKKRILFLQCFPLWGCGSGTYTRELAIEINKEKNSKVAIVCPEKKRIPGIEIYPLELPFPVAFTGHPEWPVCRLYKDLSSKEIADLYSSFLKSVIRAVEDFCPNILHVQHISLLLWTANFIKALYGVNYVVTGHGTGIFCAEENKKYIPLSLDSLRQAKKIVLVSNDTKEKFLKIFGQEFREKTKIIPGGIQLEDYPLQKDTKTIDKKYKLENKKVVFFAGKLTKKKGIEYLIKAAGKIKGDIYIAGDGPERKNLEDLTYKLSLNNVHFLGYMGDKKEEEYREFHYRADVFVAPSVWDEPLGLVILEALASKTPVIATRKGGIPLAIKNGVNGFLIRPRNSSQIIEAVNKLLENDELRKKMGENAREIVEKKFTWKRIAKKYQRIYRNFSKNGNLKNGK